MAATVLVRDVLWRVSVLLQDTDPQFVRWTERELVHWLNDAQRAIAKYVPLANSRVDAIKLSAGTRQSIGTIAQADVVPGDGVALTGPVYGISLINPRRNMGSNGSTPGRAVRMVERDMLDAFTPNWHSSTGSAVREVTYDPQTPDVFYVNPGVTGNVWLELAYAARPFDIPNTAAAGSEAYLNSGSSTVRIGIDDQYTDDLVDYVVARASLKDTKFADPIKHSLHQARFLASLNAKVAAVTGTDPNLTTLPGVTQRT